MASISVPNPSISNSETSDVTKLTANDNAIISGLSDGTKDLTVNLITTNNVVAGTDVYTVALFDYSSLSTIVGWSSFTTKTMYVKKVGKTVDVYFSFIGVSNADTTTFTVPYTADGNIGLFGGTLTDVVDGGTAVTTSCRFYLAGGGATVICKKNMTDAFWTASGNKTIQGQLRYEAA